MTRSQRLLAGFFTAAGALHFLRPGMYEQIMPDYLPAQRELVLVSGVAQIGGALGLISPRTRRLAGLWLAATLVAVLPANVHMAVHQERYPGLSPKLLWARLALQPLAIWWAIAATTPAPDEA